jgi:phage-related protein
MAYADEQSYEEMISALQSFITEGDEECTTLDNAGRDCVDNTDGDPAAEKCSARLQECTGNIRNAFQRIQGIIQALQLELERIRETARKADSID